MNAQTTDQNENVGEPLTGVIVSPRPGPADLDGPDGFDGREGVEGLPRQRGVWARSGSVHIDRTGAGPVTLAVLASTVWLWAMTLAGLWFAVQAESLGLVFLMLGLFGIGLVALVVHDARHGDYAPTRTARARRKQRRRSGRRRDRVQVSR